MVTDTQISNYDSNISEVYEQYFDRKMIVFLSVEPKKTLSVVTKERVFLQ